MSIPLRIHPLIYDPVASKHCPDCGRPGLPLSRPGLGIEIWACPTCQPELFTTDERTASSMSQRKSKAARKEHNHATIGKAGKCPTCRASNIKLIADAPSRYVLSFPDASGFAIVPAYAEEVAHENAWATGCNPGGRSGSWEIDPADVTSARVPLCTLLTGAAAVAAADQLMAATGDTTPQHYGLNWPPAGRSGHHCADCGEAI
jgi:hypothetical protein